MAGFEYDPNKSRENERRHGINFVQAQELWDSTHIIIPAKNVSWENRYAIVGKIKGKIYIAIFTQREEAKRVISCHRADKRWEKIYEKYIQEK